MGRLQHLRPIALRRFWTSPKRAGAGPFQTMPKSFRCEETTALGRFHPCATRTSATSASGCANPIERPSTLDKQRRCGIVMNKTNKQTTTREKIRIETYFISRSGGQNKFGVGIKRQTVDFCRVGIDRVRGAASVAVSRVPNHQLLIVSHGTEERFVQQVPGYIFDDSRVTRKDGFSIQDSIFSRRSVDVPQTNGVVVRGRQ